jgi:hypothetical protein
MNLSSKAYKFFRPQNGAATPVVYAKPYARSVGKTMFVIFFASIANSLNHYRRLDVFSPILTIPLSNLHM